MKSWIVSFCLVSFPVMASSVLEVKFEDLPRLVQNQNKTARAGVVSVEASEAKTGFLWRSYLPTLKVHGGYENFRTGPSLTETQPYGAAEININLFRGGKDSLEDSIRESQVTATKAQAQKELTNELTKARQYYWSLVFNSELVAIFKDALDQNKSQLLSAQRRIDRGVTGQTDRIEFEINKSVLEEEIESLKHENRIIQIGLGALVGLSKGSNLQTAEVVPHEHDDPLLGLVPEVDASADFALPRVLSEIAEAQRRINARWWIPQLDLYASYNLYTQRDREYSLLNDRDDSVFGIRMTMDLFDGGQSIRTAQSFSGLSQAYSLQAEQQRTNLIAQIEMAKEEMKHNHELIHQAEKRIEQSKIYLKRTLEEYARGVKNSPDVLNATQKYFAFRKRHAELRKDYQLSKVKLLALVNQ